MKRRLLLCFVPAALVAGSAGAQTPFHTLAPGEVLRGQFTQERTLAGFAHPLRSSGDFVLASGHGLIWRTLQPFQIVTVITAAGLVQDVNGSETTRLGAAQVPFLSRFYHVLSSTLGGDWHALEEQFQTRRQGDAQHWELDLLPRGGGDPQAMPFAAIALHGGRFVDDVRISRNNGDSDHLTFSAQALGGALSQEERGLLRQAGP